MSNEIHIAVAVDAKFMQHLAVMVCSVLENTKFPDRIRLYVIGSEVCIEDQERLDRMVRQYGCRMTYFEFDHAQLSDCPTHGHVDLATYFRLLLHRVLPFEIKSCLYLDCDMVVLGDVADLWNEAQDSRYQLSGVHEPLPDRDLEPLNLKNDSEYINAGVLWVNLEMWREVGIEQKFFEVVRNKREHLLFWDQDVINLSCDGQKKLLPKGWNLTRAPALRVYLRLLFRLPSVMPNIVHYTSGSKPWSQRDAHPLRGLYWCYRKKTPWARHQMPTTSLKDRYYRLRQAASIVYHNFRDLISPKSN